MRNSVKSVIIALMALTLIFAFSSCGKSASDGDEGGAEGTVKELYTNEDGKTVDDLNAEAESFYGKWEATSSNAKNLFGNLEVNIKEDGTFDGNVTEEDFSGTWKKVEGGLEFESIYINGTLYFAGKCQLVIYDDYSSPVVLTKIEE